MSTHWLFAVLQWSAIFGSCISLAAFDSYDRQCLKQSCQDLLKFQEACAAFFILEMFVLILASGWKEYVAENWNRFDLVCAIIGVTEFIGLQGPWFILGILRVLRPFRTIRKFEGLRILVCMIFDVIPMLGNVLILTLFFLLFFALVGVQLWKGIFHYGCYNDMNELYVTDGYGYVCSTSWGLQTCPPTSNSTFDRCLPGGPVAFKGAISFDNVLMASMIVFQTLTGEGWMDVMEMTMKASTYWVWIFFIVVLVVGSWFIVNLSLVVIVAQFKVTKRQFESRVHRKTKIRFWKEVVFTVVEYLQLLRHWIHRNKLHPSDNPAATMANIRLELERRATELQTSQEIFKVIDADGNGTISSTEMWAALLDLRAFLSNDEIDRLMRSIDTDGNGRIDHQEFHQLMFPPPQEEVLPNENAEKGPKSKSLRQRWVRICQLIVVHKWYKYFIVGCILLNGLILSLNHAYEPQSLQDVTEYFCNAFTVIFTIEIILSFSALGAVAFMYEEFNVLDLIIVVLSIFDMIGGGSSFVALRSIRMLRLLKLSRFSSFMHEQLELMGKTLDRVLPYLLLLFLFLFAFAIVGMYLFGGRFEFPDLRTCPGTVFGPPRQDYDTFFQAFLTCFRVLTFDNWNILMYDTVYATNIGAAVFYFVLLLFGHYLLVNLLIAIVIEAFAADPRAVEKFKEIILKRNNDLSTHNDDSSLRPQPLYDGLSVAANNPPPLQEVSVVSASCIVAPTVPVDDVPQPRLRPTPIAFGRRRLHHMCRSIIHSGVFTYLLTTMIFCNMSTMIMAGNLRRYSFWPPLELKLEIFFATLFLIEFLVKLMALGVWHHRHGYFSKLWNVFDFTLLLASWLLIMLKSQPQASVGIKILLILRSMRPLRLVHRFPRLQEAVESLVLSARPLFNTFCVGMLFFFMFSGLGVSLFKGSFNHCDPAPGPASNDSFCAPITAIVAQNETDCLNQNGTWWSESVNFDNMIQAMATMYIVMSKDGWVSILHVAIDSQSEGQPLKRDANRYAGIYFMVFLLIMSYFVLTMLVGVIVENFQRSMPMWLHTREVAPAATRDLAQELKNTKSAVQLRLVAQTPKLMQLSNHRAAWHSSSQVASISQSSASHIDPDHRLVHVQNRLRLRVFSSPHISGVKAHKGHHRHHHRLSLLDAKVRKHDVANSLRPSTLPVLMFDAHLNNKKATYAENLSDPLSMVPANKVSLSSLRRRVSRAQALHHDWHRGFAGTLQPHENASGIKPRSAHSIKDAIWTDVVDETGIFNHAEDTSLFATATYHRLYSFIVSMCQTFLNWKHYDAFISGVLTSNLIVMSVNYYEQPTLWGTVHSYLDIAFLAVYTLEALTLMFGFGVKSYVLNHWHKLDLLIIATGYLTFVIPPASVSIVHIMKLLRVLRIFKLIRFASGVLNLLHTIYASMTQVFAISTLMLVVFIVYGIVGVELFGNASCSSANGCTTLDHMIKFETFGSSLLALAVIAGGDSFHDITRDLIRTPPACDASNTCTYNCCANTWLVHLYFDTFVLVMQFILLNTVVAVLTKNLSDDSRNEPDPSEISSESSIGTEKVNESEA